ncbi:MAG: hypothetical protein ABIP85_04725 [Chthoniobacteraceae bacterium]
MTSEQQTSPNHALQPTAPAVTACAADRRHLSTHRHRPRQPRPSLSLESGRATLLPFLFVFCIAAASADDAAVPFKLDVVPATSEAGKQKIRFDEHNATTFHAVLTNISKEPKAVFEHWNAWGNPNISFEIKTADGAMYIASMVPKNYTYNRPSTFLILPGEHYVYEFKLNNDWETKPHLSYHFEKAEKPITFKAIYRAGGTEATKQNVWIGRVESKTYNFILTP